MSEQTNARKRTPAYADWIPFFCVLAAILLVGGSGVTWVISPNWGKHNTISAPRDIGTVPSVIQGAQVHSAAFVSPFMIEIPRLKVKGTIVSVPTEPDGALTIPENPKTVGWWEGGAKPGADKGTALLAGHINYAGVEGTLARIGTLNPGDTVIIDGLSAGKKTSLKFKITGVRTYLKTALPYQQIFDQNTVSRLAIVTCGGPFDASTGNYLDNIVAYAVPA
jgi:hypothetical protein